jgi:outer membrane protein assembly factor BamB
MTLSIALVLAPILASSARGDDWPQFRGAGGAGVGPDAHIALEWSEGSHVAWKVELPGTGWSQPVVVGDLVFVTAAVAEGLEHPMGFAAGVADPRTAKAGTPPDVEIDWQVIALDLATGAKRWNASAAHGKPRFPIHPSNTYASETPAADANGVYALFGATGTLAAYDRAGKPLWKKELGARPTTQGYGTASSLALEAGKLFVQSFDDEQAVLVCFDTKSGAEKWRVARPEPGTSWSSPLLWHNAKRVELVVSSGKLITSHDPETGKELWRLTGVEGPSMCSFAADAEHLYFGQRGAMQLTPLYALNAGASGDLSPKKDSIDLGSQAWQQKAAAPTMASPVAADGLLYVTSDSILMCRDAASGELLYKERVGELSTIAASPVIVGDKLVLIDEEGKSAVVRVGPELEILGQGKLDDMFWSSPAVAGDALLLRGAEKLYCVRP